MRVSKIDHKFTLKKSVVIAQNYALNESIVIVTTHRELLSYEFTMLTHRQLSPTR